MAYLDFKSCTNGNYKNLKKPQPIVPLQDNSPNPKDIAHHKHTEIWSSKVNNSIRFPDIQ